MTLRQIDVRIGRGIWIRMLPMVYVLAGHPRSWEQRLMAAVLWAGPCAVASYRSAAALHGLPDLPQGHIEVTTTCAQRVIHDGIRVHRTRRLEVADKTTVRGIPVTSPARTLVDLARVLPPLIVARALDAFFLDGRLSISATWRHLNRLGTMGRRGTPELRDMLVPRSGRGGRAESASETDLHEILWSRGVDGWHPQVEIFDGDRLVARPDVVFEEERLVIEMLGWKFHGSPDQRRSDARRQNELERLGYTVLQFFWEDAVFDPDYVADHTIATRRAIREPREQAS